MKYQLILVYAFIASSMTVVERQSSNDSTLFETIRELYVNFHDSIENHFSIFDFFSMDIVQVVFFVLVLFCAMRLALFLKEFVRLLKKRGHSFSSLVNNILPESAWFVFSAGMLIYYLGYAYGGTVDSFITLTLRAALSSFEMFLSKSNLIGIAENCKADSLYMFFFAFFHASAVMVSMVFAVTCFGKRIVDYGRGLVWQWSPIKSELHVFWGLNEKSILMAKDIYFQARDRSKIVFIDHETLSIEVVADDFTEFVDSLKKN